MLQNGVVLYRSTITLRYIVSTNQQTRLRNPAVEAQCKYARGVVAEVGFSKQNLKGARIMSQFQRLKAIRLNVGSTHVSTNSIASPRERE